MKHLKYLLGFAVLSLIFHMPSVMAQDSEMGLAKLSAADENRHREILEKPIDENQLNLKKIDAYKEKEHAFTMLGEDKGREENLIAWSKIDPDGKWSLRAYWGAMGKYEEAIRIGNEIINESKFPPSSARIRLYMAVDYLQTNQIDKAKELLDKAESIIKYDFGRVPRNGGTVIWIIRAETEFYAYKSIYLSRIGKAEEALTMARLALEKSKELLKLIPNIPSELYRTFARGPTSVGRVVIGWKDKKEEPGIRFNYTELCPLTIGMVIRHATQQTLAQFAQQHLWQPMGAEGKATWLTDSNGFEYNCVGFAAQLRDWARLAQLVVQKGKMGSTQVVSKSWIEDCTKHGSQDAQVSYGKARPGAGYKNFFWHHDPQGRLLAMNGALGQKILMDMETETVLVHTSVSDEVGPWTADLFPLFFAATKLSL